MKIYFDGGRRPNPGPIETMVVVRGRPDYRRDCGEGSSHEAEWRALLHAIDIAKQLRLDDVELLGDSKAVVDQVNGRQKCRSAVLRECLETYQREIQVFRRVRLRHIKRTQNLAGIELGKMTEAPTFGRLAPLGAAIDEGGER
ncbi:MAG: reverse transcriptase-like protein [Sphingosinicella sp.]|nr:reverse transcriptase-like protein [Sphingosinicella sp.]